MWICLCQIAIMQRSTLIHSMKVQYALLWYLVERNTMTTVTLIAQNLSACTSITSTKITLHHPHHNLDQVPVGGMSTWSTKYQVCRFLCQFIYNLGGSQGCNRVYMYTQVSHMHMNDQGGMLSSDLQNPLPISYKHVWTHRMEVIPACIRNIGFDTCSSLPITRPGEYWKEKIKQGEKITQ